MSRLTVLTWLAQEERTIPFLAKSSGTTVEELVAFLAGSGDGDTEMLSALELALGLPEGELQRDDDVAGSQSIDDPLRCYTVDEVAARMQVHPDTVRKEIRAGVLKAVRVGDRGVRIPHGALEMRLSRWE